MFSVLSAAASGGGVHNDIPGSHCGDVCKIKIDLVIHSEIIIQPRDFS